MNFMFKVIQEGVNSVMRGHGAVWVIGWLCFYSTLAWGLSFPNNLSRPEGQEIANAYGMQNVHRMNGPANSIGIFPGVYPGVEFMMIFPPKVENVGIGNGQLSRFMPTPRIFVTKGLPLNIDINLHAMPFFLLPAYHGWGANVKWAFLTEQVSFAALAVKVSYDYSEFVFSAIKTGTFGLSGVISQDFVGFIPYAGIGLLYSGSTLDAAFNKSGNKEVFESLGFHGFVGTQIKSPLTFNLEIGMAGTSFYAGVSVGKNFFDELPRDQMQ
jgi:hypothetical protein